MHRQSLPSNRHASATSHRGARAHPHAGRQLRPHPHPAPARLVVAAAAAEGGSRGGDVLRQVLTGPERTKLDTGDDRGFYDVPRLVKHVDDGFLDQVTELYRQRIPEGGAVLDLCSSWVSHLPPEVTYSKVVGHGMNAAELARNPRLDSFFVRNLNTNPDGWAAADQSFDAVVCCVSVQYMQQPEKVFAEVYRVLKPGGVVIVTFSNRLFYTKAIAAWRDASGYARCQLVKQYFQAVAGFTTPEVLTEVPKVAGAPAGGTGGGSLPQWLKPLSRFFERTSSDPFYAVVAYRNFRRE
ncbi:hypothetical protein HYH02_008466 [Chlamydomonas schloesseri]|uniref:Methyltransferase type 11 domain-containing protein n=1 Tax=Chlamydomonas schloesseri TaxID=2026947 RepID=A0A835WG84_9CHLO|nr:hypothetical protein HYH02_008466 [Chlamydomonas schloesseri]|eukprot:KAG2446475.1 hypothetical protein HYH02_008466 [Chlamydomonas schloesseri]